MDGGGVFADPRGVGAGAFGSKLAPAFGEETRTGGRERLFDVFWHLAGEEPGGEERALGEDVDDALPPGVFEGFEVYPYPVRFPARTLNFGHHAASAFLQREDLSLAGVAPAPPQTARVHELFEVSDPTLRPPVLGEAAAPAAGLESRSVWMGRLSGYQS